MIYVTRPREKILSVIIQLPQSFQYKNNNKVPWNYRMQVITTRENKPKIEEGEVGNLTLGLGGIIRSGRCYTLEELEKRRKEMGKTTEDPTVRTTTRGPNGPQNVTQLMNDHPSRMKVMLQ